MKRKSVIDQLVDQQRWIEEHGGTLAGYVARYGSKDDPDHYGNGGEAIYAADMDEFNRLARIARQFAGRK